MCSLFRPRVEPAFSPEFYCSDPRVRLKFDSQNSKCQQGAPPSSTRQWSPVTSHVFSLSTFNFQLLTKNPLPPVLPIPAVLLTFSVYEEAHWRSLKRPRLEFRGARGNRRGGGGFQTGDPALSQQSPTIPRSTTPRSGRCPNPRASF